MFVLKLSSIISDLYVFWFIGNINILAKYEKKSLLNKNKNTVVKPLEINLLELMIVCW